MINILVLFINLVFSIKYKIIKLKHQLELELSEF